MAAVSGMEWELDMDRVKLSKAEWHQKSFIFSGVVHHVSNDWRIFMNCECKRRTQGRNRTILELQEALLSERLEDSGLCGVTDISALMVLETRLERVRSWGGPFSEIDFSEDLKDILRERNCKLRHQQVAS